MEKIYVSYSTASALYANGSVVGYHKVLNYINNEGKHVVIEGQPSVEFKTTSEKANAFLKASDQNTTSPFGRLTTQGQLNAPSTYKSQPKDEIIEGADLSAYWAKIKTFGNDVNAGNYEYRPMGQNSNSFVDGALQKAGLPAASGYAIYPDDPNATPVEFWEVPGSGIQITRRVSDPASQSTLNDLTTKDGDKIHYNYNDDGSFEVDFKNVGKPLPASEIRSFIRSNGTMQERIVTLDTGAVKDEHYRADGTIAVATGSDASGNIFTEGFDALGNLASYVFKSASGQQLSLTGDGIGSVLGSSIGSAIGGKNFATKVVTTTLIGSLGQTIGGLLNIQGNAGKSLIAQVNGASTLDTAFSQAVSSFGKAVPINLLNNVTGGVSSMLMGELANSLGLKGFAAGAFTTVGTTFTTQNAANDNGFVRARNYG